MSIDEYTDALTESVTEVFEEMAFAEVEKIEKIDTLPEVNSEDFFALIELKNPVSGFLKIIIGEKYAVALVESMLGEKLESSYTLINDSIAELTNTIGGSFLRILTKNNGDCQLGIPSSGKIADNQSILNHNDKSVNMVYVIEENEIYVSFKTVLN